MKNKATLTLIELSVMLLVFALAATLCMRAFVWANETSDACDARDQALLQAQSVAEVLKCYGSDIDKAAAMFGGRWTEENWSIHYNGQWEQVDAPDTYQLIAAPQQSGTDLLGIAEIRVLYEETLLIQMEVAWQEVIPDG